MMHLPYEFPRWSRTGATPVPDRVKIITGSRRSRRDQAGAAAKSPVLAPHVAFALAFRPSQRLLHRFALMVSQAHLGQDGLRIDLLGDLRRRWRGGDRKLLVVIRIWVMEKRTLRRPFLGPRLEGGELLKRGQVITAARCHKLFNRSGLRQMDQQALGGLLVLGETPNTPKIRKEWRKPALGSCREAVRPALLGDLRRVPLGYRPGAGRIHNQCTLAGN